MGFDGIDHVQTRGQSGIEAARTASGSQAAVKPISAYSASLAAPVGAEFAYEIFGCGLNPALNAIGRPARRMARSRAR